MSKLKTIVIDIRGSLEDAIETLQYYQEKLKGKKKVYLSYGADQYHCSYADIEYEDEDE